jgi:hypothetical protein
MRKSRSAKENSVIAILKQELLKKFANAVEWIDSQVDAPDWGIIFTKVRYVGVELVNFDAEAFLKWESQVKLDQMQKGQRVATAKVEIAPYRDIKAIVKKKNSKSEKYNKRFSAYWLIIHSDNYQLREEWDLSWFIEQAWRAFGDSGSKFERGYFIDLQNARMTKIYERGKAPPSSGRMQVSPSYVTVNLVDFDTSYPLSGDPEIFQSFDDVGKLR